MAGKLPGGADSRIMKTSSSGSEGPLMCGTGMTSHVSGANLSHNGKSLRLGKFMQDAPCCDPFRVGLVLRVYRFSARGKATVVW